MLSDEEKKANREYNSRPEVMAKQKEYYQRPEVKARVKEYRQQEKYKTYRKKYRQRPEVKARVKEYNKEYLMKYNQRSENKAKKNENQKRNYQRVEVKAKYKEYRQRVEVKERRKEYLMQYNQFPEVKAKYKQYIKEKYINDNIFRIKSLLRNRLWTALKLYTTTGKIKEADKYGIDYKTIIKYLKPFPKDRHLYHIDHIRPLVSFNLEDPEEIKLAFAPENHQWLLAYDNLVKGSKIAKQVTL